MKTKFIMSMRLLTTLTVVAAIFFSCEKSEPIPQPAPAPSGGVFISNEGSFLSNGATISYYNIASGAISKDIYGPYNSEQLGDIAHSMSMINGKLYVVINNSHKIVAIDPVTFKKTGAIDSLEGLPSPRFIAPGAGSKAYVTNLTFDIPNGKISVVDLNTNKVTKTIAIVGFTEELLSRNGFTYVTNYDADYLYIINHSTDAISDSILLGKKASSLAFDKNGKLWVACGQYGGGEIKQVNITSKTVEKSFSFGSPAIKKIRMNGAGDNFYFNVANKVYKMGINDNVAPSTAFYTNTDITDLYGLGFDTKNDVLYVSNGPISTPGTVYRVKKDGLEIDKFTVGLYPGEFVFNIK